MKSNPLALWCSLAAGVFVTGCATSPDSCCQPGASAEFTPLFPQDGIPAGWRIGAWNDVNKPGPSNTVWRVTGGMLQPEGAAARGS